MELFFAKEIDGKSCYLGEEESAHCVRVLRHREGDEIHVIDGAGSFYRCRLCDASPKAAVAQILDVQQNWGGHPYRLTMAVCPTKNNERYEWFAEKATEMGLDTIAPVIGEHSERRIFKAERLHKILLSATKQSLKAAIPQISDPCSVRDFIASHSGSDELKMMAYCFEDEVPRRSVREILELEGSPDREIVILIGPEGDFSREEARLALQAGFIPVHIGDSRLRTETAALTACAAVYLHYMR